MTQADLIDEARIAASGLTASGAKPELVLKSSEFRKGREEGWRELENLVQRVERRGVRSLTLDELQQLPMLYRAALSSLSVACTIALDRNLLLYLENLALRAYLVVYGPRVGAHRRAARIFLSYDLPAAVRAARWHILVADDCTAARRCSGLPPDGSGRGLDDSPRAVRLGGRPRTFGDSGGAAQQRVVCALAGRRRSVRHFCQRAVQDHNTLVGLLSFGLGLAGRHPDAAAHALSGFDAGSVPRAALQPRLGGGFPRLDIDPRHQ